MENVKSQIGLLLLAVFVAFNCQKQVDCCVIPPCSESATLNGTWKLKGYLDMNTNAFLENPNSDDRGVVFTFKDDKNMGALNGYTVANEVNGKYNLLANCMIEFTSFGGTKRGENEWSGKTWELLQGNGTYSIIAGTLNIDFIEAKMRMVFVKE